VQGGCTISLRGIHIGMLFEKRRDGLVVLVLNSICEWSIAIGSACSIKNGDRQEQREPQTLDTFQ
jgi:hypothetical protein